MMQNCEMSADEPEVVGRQSSGGPGTSTRSIPSNSPISLPLVCTMPMPLAQSMALPPPSATSTSQRSRA